MIQQWDEQGFAVNSGIGTLVSRARICKRSPRIDSASVCNLADRYDKKGCLTCYHKAKIVRKTLIPAVLLLLYDYLSLKSDVNVPAKSNNKKLSTKNCVAVLNVTDENSRIRCRIRIRQM